MHSIYLLTGDRTAVSPFALALVAIGLICKGYSARADTSYSPPPISVPDGFEVHLVAAPPLVTAPTHACFDDRGRLFVCESYGLNVQREELLKQLPRDILMLEDSDGDGVFDRRTVFADKLTFPMGCQWHDGALYVVAPPKVWRLKDTDGDGKADRRDVIVEGFRWSGRSSSVKGPFLGPDGRFYIAGGYEGYQLSSPNGTNTLDSQGRKAPGVFSCRTDGSDLELFASGAAGAYGLTFSADGEIFGVNTLMRSPRGDGMTHWVYGGIYPTTLEHPLAARRTGPLMPILREWGQTSPVSCLRYRGTHLGQEYQDCIFNTHFNTHKVLCTRIVSSGASYTATDEEFLASSGEDFHPTDIVEDADGSLLVVDTGGWFIMACPTSRIGKPEVNGAIYRVRRRDGDRAEDPRGLNIRWSEIPPADLIALLDDPRPAVRDRAVAVLAKADDRIVGEIVDAVPSASTARLRRNCVWTLARHDTPAAHSGLRVALRDGDAGVRKSALRALLSSQDRKAIPRLLKIVADDQPSNRRLAAAVLGRIGSIDSVPALLSALRNANDRFLEHAIIYALIEINASRPTIAGLTDANSRVKRGALIALDHMDQNDIHPETLVPLLETDDLDLLSAAVDVVAAHQGWGQHLVGLLRDWLIDDELDEHRQAILLIAIQKLQRDPHIQRLVADIFDDPSTPIPCRLRLLGIVGQARARDLPRRWEAILQSGLSSDESPLVFKALSAIERLGVKQFDGILLGLATNRARPVEVRAEAATLCNWRDREIPKEIFQLMITRCNPKVAPIARLAAARAIGSASLDAQQQLTLLKLIAEAGPLELPALVMAFNGHTDRPTGRKLLSALERSPGVANFPAGKLRELLRQFPSDVQVAGAPLLRRLDPDDKAKADLLASLEPALTQGDIERGERLFFDKQAGCFACHQVGNAGGGIGPNLSHIGRIRSPRDLLESIALPSATIVTGYETYTVTTKSGKSYTGVIRKRTVNNISLGTQQLAEILIPRSDIDSAHHVNVSVMPDGVSRTMSTAKLADIIAFLDSLQ